MKFEIFDIQAKSICKRPITACKQYCLAAGATQGNIAYTQTVKMAISPIKPYCSIEIDSKKQSTKVMKAIFSATIKLSLTLSLVFYGCTTQKTDNSQSNDISSDTAMSITQQANSTDYLGTENNELKQMYTQAIGDYIRLVNEEYKLTFDTLYLGKHENGEPTDFPDIELPAAIENTRIKLISPEHAEENQKGNKSAFFINLFSSVNSDHADFIFVTFTNGFAHQFDCFIEYEYDTSEKRFVVATSRFENYRYKKK